LSIIYTPISCLEITTLASRHKDELIFGVLGVDWSDTEALMGLFDEVVGGLEAEAGQKSALYEEVASLVTQAGGVSGLAQQFQQKGMEGMISGWISNGANPSISGEQVVQVLGQEKVTAIAAKVGLSEQQVVDGISKILPVIINHLTPNGTTSEPAAGELEGALGALKSKLLSA
jgi:uncharacterized protein YidB (DUF937 family)